MELCYYRYIIDYMDYENLDNPNSKKQMRESGLVAANSYSDATYKVCDYYGQDEVISITLSGELDCDVITDEEICEIIKINKETKPWIQKDC